MPNQVRLNPISGIGPIKSNIKIEKFDLEDKYPFQGSATEPITILPKKIQFQSFKVYKHLKLKKMVKNNKHINYIVLTNQTINELYSSFEESYDKFLKTKSKIKTVYLDHLFGKSQRVTNEGILNARSKEVKDIVKQFLTVCHNNFIIIENINNIYSLPDIKFFDIAYPIFAHVDVDNKLHPYIRLITANNVTRSTFLNLTITICSPHLKHMKQNLTIVILHVHLRLVYTQAIIIYLILIKLPNNKNFVQLYKKIINLSKMSKLVILMINFC